MALLALTDVALDSAAIVADDIALNLAKGKETPKQKRFKQAILGSDPRNVKGAAKEEEKLIIKEWEKLKESLHDVMGTKDNYSGSGRIKVDAPRKKTKKVHVENDDLETSTTKRKRPTLPHGPRGRLKPTGLFKGITAAEKASLQKDRLQRLGLQQRFQSVHQAFEQHTKKKPKIAERHHHHSGGRTYMHVTVIKDGNNKIPYHL